MRAEEQPNNPGQDFKLQGCHVTLENKTPAETFSKFPSVLRVIDRSDQNPPITATSMTFRPSFSSC